MVDFENTVIHVPGCHGKSIIRFDFIPASNPDQKIGTCTFLLSKDTIEGSNLYYQSRNVKATKKTDEDGTLLFWGGRYSKLISLIKSGRSGGGSSRSFSKTENSTLTQFEFSMSPGLALKSRAEWVEVSINVSGISNWKKQLNRFISSFFDDWGSFFLSIDGQYLRFFYSQHAPGIWLQIPVSDITKVCVEQGFSKTKSRRSVNYYPADTKNIVITTATGDRVCLRFPDAKKSQAWLAVFEKVIADLNFSGEASSSEKSRVGDSIGLLVRLASSNFSSKRRISSIPLH